MPPSKSAFSASRLTSSTFLIKETDDIYDEHHYIYAKLVPRAQTIVLIDTGCGGATNDTTVQVTSLRKFLETVAVEDNDMKPLNPDGLSEYIVIQSHCHYDHILAVEQFAGSVVLASGYDESFLSSDKLPIHSLCHDMGIETPQYTPTTVPHEYAVRHGEIALGITILHTPGHTPDELAVYDKEEKMLYVGDTLYEDELIIFPNEGSIVGWFGSVDKLLSIATTSDEIRINAGHSTALRPATQVILGCRTFIEDVINGKAIEIGRMIVRGEINILYSQEGSRFSLRCPERLVLDAHKWLGEL